MKSFDEENQLCGFERKMNVIEGELDQNIRKINERAHRLLNELNGTIDTTSQKAVHSGKRKKRLKISYYVSVFLFLALSTFVIYFGVWYNSKTKIDQFADQVSTKFKNTRPFQSNIDVNQNTIQIRHLIDEIKHSSDLNEIINEYGSDYNIHIIKIIYLDNLPNKEYDLNKIKDNEDCLKPGYYKAIFVASKDQIIKQGNISIEIKKRG